MTGLFPYQNEDGTLTPAGKIRYAKEQKKLQAQKDYEEAFNIIKDQMKRISVSRALANSMSYSTPAEIMKKGYGKGVYESLLAQEIAKITISDRVLNRKSKITSTETNTTTNVTKTKTHDPSDDWTEYEGDDDPELRELWLMEQEEKKRGKDS